MISLFPTLKFTSSQTTMSEITTTPSSRPLPVREDCWSEEATATLVDVWGNRFLDLNRGNLRQKDWQDVADAVNARHGHSKKTFRTDIQCKNRVDTVKKKYKSEKARVSSSNGLLTSDWIFYDRLHELIGSIVSARKYPPSPPLALPVRKVPLLTFSPVILPQKRSATVMITPPANDSYFRKNYSAVAAAAAADVDEDFFDDDDDDLVRSRSSEDRDGDVREVEGIRELARAIERFGDMYERVEAEKQRQMIELEKQRMQVTKDLEVQRMQLFMNTQVQLEKIKKRSKGSGSNDIYS